jgi:hypothetical protein
LVAGGARLLGGGTGLLSDDADGCGAGLPSGGAGGGGARLLGGDVIDLSDIYFITQLPLYFKADALN